MTNQIITIIPVRLASTRLPNKPLADICGKSMVHRVYEQAKKADLGEVLIACDGEEIANEAKKIGANFVITDPNLPSGTDRIYEALCKFGGDFKVVLNLQGDLPNIDPSIIKIAANCALKEDCDIATLACPILTAKEVMNPNIVKIAKAQSGRALYFSRSPIPYSKDLTKEQYLHHIGIYAYKSSALKKFVSLTPSELEKRESLEQLRALENDMKIMVKTIDTLPLSVDTAEDLERVKQYISSNFTNA